MVINKQIKITFLFLMWSMLFVPSTGAIATDVASTYALVNNISFQSSPLSQSQNNASIRVQVKNDNGQVISGNFRLVIENANLPILNASGINQHNQPYFLIKKGVISSINPAETVNVILEYQADESIPLTFNAILEQRLELVTNNLPVANAGIDQSRNVDDMVYLDGSKSLDQDAQRLSYQWRLESKPQASNATLLNANSVRPNFNLDADGQYIFTLTVNDGAENSHFDRVLISTSSIPPQAQAGNDTLVTIGETVILDGSASNDVNGELLSYLWVLEESPEGSTAVLENQQSVKPKIDIDRAGEYVLHLSVSDGTSRSLPDHLRLTDGELAPVANAGIDQAVIINAIAQLDASASFAVDAQPLSYRWTLVNAPIISTSTLSDTTIINPTLLIDQPGDYIIQLIVNDGTNDSQADQVIISTNNIRPIAQAGDEQTVLVDENVQLNAGNSIDANGDVLNFQWSLIHKPAISATSLTSVSDLLSSFIADASGQYVVQLVVNDGQLDSFADTLIINAEASENEAPVIQSSPVASAQVNAQYTYSVSATDANSDTLSYSFIQSPIGMTIDSASGVIRWKPFSSGAVLVVLQVSDGRGGVDTQPFVINVKQANRRPVINSTAIKTATIDKPYQYVVHATDEDGDNLAYRLLAAPLGLVINRTTGNITWLPKNVGAENVNVEIEVDDGRGGLANQQYSINLRYPGDNKPPIFTTLTDKIVPVGSKLQLQLAAQDPEGKDISYGAQPLPLPENLTLNTKTGMLTFKPAATQSGEYNLLISASDSRFTTTQNLKLIVPAVDLNAPTSFKGRVVDANSASDGIDLPIVGATISFLNTSVSTVTDEQGYFTLINLPPTAATFSIDGSTANPAPGGASYASFRELLSLIEHTENIESRPFYMPRNNMGSMVQVDPNQTTMVENTDIDVTLEIAPNSAMNDDGTPFFGQISITQVPAGLAPASLPENFDPAILVTIQPAGIRFTTPAQITFPNIDNLPPGTELSIMSVDPDTGVFTPTGTAVVSADGKYIVTTSGGIIESDWSFPSVQVIDEVSVGTKDNDGTKPTCTGSTTCLKDGRMSQSVSLPEYRSLEADRAVTLTYQTSRAGQVAQALQNLGTTSFTNRQRIQVKITYKLVRGNVRGGLFSGRIPDPDYTKITTTIAGIEGTETFLGVPPASQTNVFTGVGLDSGNIGTGMYTVTTNVVVKVGFSISGVTSKSETLIINESASPFGAGWMIDNIDRLHFHATTGTALLVSADGRYKVYKFDEITQTYITPKGNFATLIKNADNTYTLTDQYGYQTFFNSRGLQTKSQDLNGNNTVYAYNTDNQLTSIIDPVGKQTLFSYDNGRITSITDPANRVTHFEHDGLGNLARIIYPDDSEMKYEYAGHLMTKKIDERNNTTQYHYDEEGFNTHVTLPDNNQRGVRSSLSKGFAVQSSTKYNPLDSFFDATSGTYVNARGNVSDFELDDRSYTTKKVDELGRITLYERDANSRPIKTTRPNGSVINKTFDILGNTTSEREDFNGALYQYTYDSHSLITRITNPNNHSVTINRDDKGNPVEIINELGHTTRIEFDTRGLPTRITTPNDLEIVRTYNADGLLETQIETPPATSTGNVRTSQYLYYASGLLKQIDTADGRTYNYTYDERSRLLSITDNLDQKQVIQYDTYGNIIAVDTTNTDGTPALHAEYGYDSRNRNNEIRLPHLQVDAITRLILDGESNVTELIDPKGSTRKMRYDKVERLDKSTHRLNGLSEFSYDLNDKITQVISPNGATTNYTYDLLGRRLSEESPDRGNIQYQYDLANNLTQQIDARGIITDYSYDELERLSSKIFPTSAAENVNLIYDSCTLGTGRLCGITDETGSSSYQYDAWGNIIQMLKTELGQTYTTAYQYDEGNNISQIRYPSGRVISITRDGVRRMQSVQTSLSKNGTTTNKILMSNSLYRADDQLMSCNYGNGLSETRSYDTQGRQTNQTTNNSASIIDLRDYNYDINNNLISRTGNVQNSDYKYDLLDRLTQDDPSSTENLDARQSTILYDLNHNRQRKTSFLPDLANAQSTQTKGYNYNSLSNQLLAEETLNVNLPLTTNNEIEELIYNAANRLSRRTITDESGTIIKTIDYLYNAKGQRTRKTQQQSGSNITTIYHYNLNGQLISESSEAAINKRDYIWHYMTPVAQINHDQQAANDTLYYLHTDHLYTPRFATNETKQIIWRWEGEAFGETKAEEDVDGNSELVVVNLRFPGQYYDEESGTHYNYFRDYDPSVGRYITADPIGILRDHNNSQLGISTLVVFVDNNGYDDFFINHLFNYVDNSPVNYIDFNGLAKKKYKKPPNLNQKKGAEDRQKTGARERNIGHPEGEEHSRRPKRGIRIRGQGGFISQRLLLALSRVGTGVGLLLFPSELGCSDLDCNGNGIPDHLEDDDTCR